MVFFSQPLYPIYYQVLLILLPKHNSKFIFFHHFFLSLIISPLYYFLKYPSNSSCFFHLAARTIFLICKFDYFIAPFKTYLVAFYCIWEKICKFLTTIHKERFAYLFNFLSGPCSHLFQTSLCSLNSSSSFSLQALAITVITCNRLRSSTAVAVLFYC